MTNILVSKSDRVLTLRIDRPQKKNALTLEMYDVLSSELEQAEAGNDIRAILVMGRDGSFCSGNDVSAFPADPAQHGPTPVMRFVEALVGCSVPIVAAVDGVAAGLGATMLLHMDSVIASAESRIVFPFVNMALVPEAGSSLLLTRQLGYTRAAELILRGAPIDGAEAHRLGIVSTLAAAGQVEARGLEMAMTFAAKPPQAMRRSKRLLRGDTAELMQRIRAEERDVFLGLASAEGKEALSAFLERRKPDFSRF